MWWYNYMPKIYNNSPTLYWYVQEGESPEEGSPFTDQSTSAGGGAYGELKAKCQRDVREIL